MQNRQITTRLMLSGLLTVALLCAATTMVLAQTPTATPTSSDRSAFYLGSIRPAIERLQSITANPFDDGASATASPDQFSVGFDGRVSLHRDFARTVADIETAPLGVSFQDTTTTRGLLSLSQRTGLSYTSTLTQNDNLIGLIMGQTRAQAYGLQQTVGNGATAGALNVTRTLTQTQSYRAADVASQTDAVGFTGGLRRANDLSVKGLRTVSDVPGGYYESNFEALYTAAFSGGDSPLGFARNEKIIAGLTTITEKMDFAIPVAWRGQKAIAEHHLTYGEAGGVTSRTRSSHVLLPFAALGPGALFDYSLVGADYGAGLSETGTARLANPFSIAGKSYALEENYITLHQPGLVSDTLLTRLSAPMSGGQAIVQHQTVSSDASGVLTEQRQVSLALPPLSHLKVLSAQAARSTTSVTGAADDNLTSFSVSCQPLRPLLVDAAYAIDDKGDLQASKTRQLRTRLALSNNLSLQGQLSEAEITGGTSNTMRLVEFARDGGSGGLGLKAGYASYGAPDSSSSAARRVELAVGKPQGIALNAAYSEYDTTTMALIPNDAIIALCLQHGDPKDFAIRARYEDQPTRLAPLKAVDVAMPLLGSSLVMSYQANPLGPDGVTMRPATQYDAGLVRKVFGDVNLQLGYRYLDYETDLVDRNIRIQLDGGQETGVGKMAISYFTGDFCTLPTDGTLTPGSSLDVTYSKSWGSDSKLTLGVQRRTAPWRTLADTSTEGRLEYSLGF